MTLPAVWENLIASYTVIEFSVTVSMHIQRNQSFHWNTEIVVNFLCYGVLRPLPCLVSADSVLRPDKGNSETSRHCRELGTKGLSQGIRQKGLIWYSLLRNLPNHAYRECLLFAQHRSVTNGVPKIRTTWAAVRTQVEKQHAAQRRALIFP